MQKGEPKGREKQTDIGNGGRKVKRIAGYTCTWSARENKERKVPQGRQGSNIRELVKNNNMNG